jgi:hypothetical protein
MTDTDQSTPQRNRRRRHVRRHVELPDGRTLIPRSEFADILGENERTTRRRNLPTLRIAGVSYVDRDGSLEIVAAGVKRPNQPAPAARSGRPTPRRPTRSLGRRA